MSYGYYTKMIKEYEIILPWTNKTTEYRIKVFEKKRESVFVTDSVHDIFLTGNSVTASVTTDFASLNMYKLQKPSLYLLTLRIP